MWYILHKSPSWLPNTLQLNLKPLIPIKFIFFFFCWISSVLELTVDYFMYQYGIPQIGFLTVEYGTMQHLKFFYNIVYFKMKDYLFINTFHLPNLVYNKSSVFRICPENMYSRFLRSLFFFFFCTQLNRTYHVCINFHYLSIKTL